MTFTVRGHTVRPLNVAMFVASIVWLAFQFGVAADARPPILNEAFLLVLGAWITSKSIEANKVEEKREVRAAATQEKVSVLEQQIGGATVAESGRVDAERQRATAEVERVDAESGRDDARVVAEAGRVDAESQRVVAEDGRVARSSDRVEAEEERNKAEHNRAEAEHRREEEGDDRR